MLVPLRLKSASMPWPIASCRRMPEAPAASTTGISPAGGRLASNSTIVRLTASLATKARRSSVYHSKPWRPARLAELAWLTPFFLAVTMHHRRVIGRTSVWIRPCMSAISTTSSPSAQLTVTFSIAESPARARAFSCWIRGSFWATPMSDHGCASA